jgi:hypothetical protein
MAFVGHGVERAYRLVYPNFDYDGCRLVLAVRPQPAAVSAASPNSDYLHPGVILSAQALLASLAR